MKSAQNRRITVLGKSAAFRDLPPATLERLAAGATESSFSRGSVVVSRGEPATAVHVVAAGQLKLTIESPEGDEHVIEIVQQGESFGDAAILSNRNHFVTASAVSTCRLLNVTRQTLLAEVARDQEFSRRLSRNLGESVYRHTRDLESFLFYNAMSRVARFLLDQLNRQGAEGGGRVRLPAHKSLIASRLNMTKEHFSRTLRSLRQSGEIKVSGATIDVLNVAGLHQIAAK